MSHRRVMSEAEQAFVRQKLRDRWAVNDGYWFPLTEDRPSNVEAFQYKYFETEVGTEKLTLILFDRGVGKLLVVGEEGIGAEIDASEIEPWYMGLEFFWCDQTFDWIIYVSHEGSITLGGWVLEDVKASWPNWRARVWTSWDFD